MKLTNKINAYNIDCIEFMKDKSDNYYDLAIVDPPYGIGNIVQEYFKDCKYLPGKNRLNSGSGKLKNRILNQSNCEWDTKPPNQNYFTELKRISKNQIIWGGNYFDLPPTRGIICWDKCQPWENFSQVELAWTSFDFPAKLFKFDNRIKGKIHPTQKPVSLYRWLLKKCAKPNFKILDTHGGSMSIAISCHESGFELDICEINKEYFDKAIERITPFLKQKTVDEFFNF